MELISQFCIAPDHRHLRHARHPARRSGADPALVRGLAQRAIPERMEEIGRNIGEFIAYLRDLFARKRRPLATTSSRNASGRGRR